MATLGKKILSAFMEVTETRVTAPAGPAVSAPAASRAAAQAVVRTSSQPDTRYADYFDKLLSDANIPGPDYYEFARMIVAMQSIPDEPARYHAAFAGLQAQGLNKDNLLATAMEYMRVLTADADHFQKTLEAALQEKVRGKESEAEEKATRIQVLSQEIQRLQQEIGALQQEVHANKEKLTGSGNAYTVESMGRQGKIQADIEKINQYIH